MYVSWIYGDCDYRGEGVVSNIEVGQNPHIPQRADTCDYNAPYNECLQNREPVKSIHF